MKRRTFPVEIKGRQQLGGTRPPASPDGPFYVEEGYVDAGKHAVLAPEPDGGSLIVFLFLHKGMAESYRDRLNDAVRLWLRERDATVALLELGQ